MGTKKSSSDTYIQLNMSPSHDDLYGAADEGPPATQAVAVSISIQIFLQSVDIC